MSNAVEILMKEHRVIEAVLDSLESFLVKIKRGEHVRRGTIGEFVEFFRNFADKCHHGKEEDLLFSALAEHGFSRETGPVSVMLYEHTVGRAHLRALSAIAQGSGSVSPSERENLLREAGAYIPLLRAHIKKEDQVLFPMALHALSADQLQNLTIAFDDFERNVMGEGEHEAFHRLADSLIAQQASAGTGTSSRRPCSQH